MRISDWISDVCSSDLQSSDWGGPVLSEAQRDYAASDVRFLHALREELDRRLTREGRQHLAQACFDFLPARAELDLAGWPETDIFAHVCGAFCLAAPARSIGNASGRERGCR